MSFDKNFGLTRKILSFLLTLTMILSLAQFFVTQVTAEAIEIDNNGNPYTSTEDETQIQPFIEEIEETGITIGDETLLQESAGENDTYENVEQYTTENVEQYTTENTEQYTSENTEPYITENAEQYTTDEETDMIQPFSVIIDTNTIIVEDETEFRAALANEQYTTIYLGTDITMSSSASNNIVVARTEPLVINGTDPREGGTRHTYTDYNGSSTSNALGGACTDITFKDININLRNSYGIYYAGNTTGTTVTLDNTAGSARQSFYGRGANSTLVIKDADLTLKNTGLGSPQEFAENTGTVNFVGTATVTRAVSSSSDFFDMTGTSTVKIEEGANVVFDNSTNTSGTIFYNVTNFTVGAGAVFSCYSGKAFCTSSTAYTLSNVTIGERADVRFIQTGGSHLYNSLYGVDGTSSFTAGPGSKFLLYDNETESTWGAFWFANITLNNVESFIVLNASGRAIGNRANTNNLTVNGASSIRYYLTGQISNLFNTGTYAYTPTRSPSSWWANTSPFGVNAAGWANAANPTLTNNTYASSNVPSSAITVQTTLTSGNFRQYGAAAYGVEVYNTVYTVTYEGNGATSGAAPVGDAGVPNDLITIKGNTGSLARTGYTFAGWNTAANGTGTAYLTNNTFRITENTTLYAQWVPDTYTISGRLSGLTSVSGLPVSYSADGGEVRTVTTDANGNYTITDVSHGSDVIITPPAQTGYSVTPGNITVSDISGNSAGKDFVYTLIPYTVTEKYVDELTGSSFGQNDTYAVGTTSPYNYSYGGLPADITAGGVTYTYIGYKVGDYSPGDTLAGSGVPEVNGLTAAATVSLIYHKINNTIDVTFPTGSNWEFYVNQDTYPYVKTGSMGSSNKYYEFKNNSDKPVYVDLTKVQVTASGGLSLVEDASLSVPGSSEYSLNLSAASPSILPAGQTNGFTTNTVTGITEGIFGAGTKQLGGLDGQYINQSTPTAANGYIAIEGYYAGNLSTTSKNPQLMFTFTFSLIP